MLCRVGGQSVFHDTNDGFPLHLGHSLLSVPGSSGNSSWKQQDFVSWNTAYKGFFLKGSRIWMNNLCLQNES